MNEIFKKNKNTREKNMDEAHKLFFSNILKDVEDSYIAGYLKTSIYYHNNLYDIKKVEKFLKEQEFDYKFYYIKDIETKKKIPHSITITFPRDI